MILERKLAQVDDHILLLVKMAVLMKMLEVFTKRARNRLQANL